MWPDNETARDFLNFSGVAETVAEIIVQAKGRPISIGISGAWGIGKSSMIKLTQASLASRARVAVEGLADIWGETSLSVRAQLRKNLQALVATADDGEVFRGP